MKLHISLLLVFISTFSFSQTEKWVKRAEKLSNKKFELKIQPSKYNLEFNKFIEEIDSWGGDKKLTGEDIYTKIINWQKYPKPKKTGIIIERKTKLDSTYTVPYYIYIPKNYSPNLPTKLLVYYKGGWMTRDSFPNNVAKEIVIDNPTFSYLDKYNVIEIFPALRSDLAIYGWYGYKHLRKMIAETKQVLNINDNQVYLVGFSDGGRTTYNIAYLTPSQFASFYSINGVFNNYKMNFPNFSNKNITSFIAKKDKIAYYKSALAMAKKANEFGANWSINLLDKGHFYFPYEKQILPEMFNQINNSYRNPFPNKIIYHKDYDFDELKGIDWLHIKTNTKREPEKWHYSSKVSIPDTAIENYKFIYGEKTSQVIANYFNNTFEIKASLVDEIEIYISPLMVDMNRPVKIIINQKEVFNQIITFDKNFIISEFIKKFDRKQVWINKINLKVE
jgi:hypothetical protein